MKPFLNNIVFLTDNCTSVFIVLNRKTHRHKNVTNTFERKATRHGIEKNRSISRANEKINNLCYGTKKIISNGMGFVH